ncbi:MAG TPA: hypothetical protein VF544_20870 [Pyrinomonadaceae bacterium]
MMAAKRSRLSVTFATSGKNWTAQFSATLASGASPSRSKRSLLFSNSAMARA